MESFAEYTDKWEHGVAGAGQNGALSYARDHHAKDPVLSPSFTLDAAAQRFIIHERHDFVTFKTQALRSAPEI